MKVKALVNQSCLTLSDPTDCSLPGFSVEFSRWEYWEQVAISFSRGSSQPRDRTWSPALQTDSLLSEPPGKPIYQTIWKHFLPASRLPFYWWFPLMCRSLLVWASPTDLFLFLLLFLLDLKNSLPRLMSRSLLPLGVLWFQMLCSSL